MNDEYNRVQKLKKKLGFDKSDTETEMEKRARIENIRPKIILSSSMPEATPRKFSVDVEQVLDEIGSDIDLDDPRIKSVEVRKSGISDNLLKEIQDSRPQDKIKIPEKDLINYLRKTPLYKYKFHIRYRWLFHVVGYTILIGIIIALILI